MQWIEKTTGQKSLFTPEKEKSPDIVVINKLKYLGTRNTLIYEVLSLMFNMFSFQKLKSKLLLDTDARILNTLTGEEIILRKEMDEEIQELWKTLTVSY